MKKNSTTNFLIMSSLAGIIGGKALVFYWDFSSETNLNLLLMCFQEHFGIILAFWFITRDKLKVNYWLFTGVIGSLIYAILSTYLRIQVLLFDLPKGLDNSIFVLILWIIINMLFATLGSLSQWLVLRNIFPKAYTWVIANAIGYGFLAIFPYLQYETIRHYLQGNPQEKYYYFYQTIHNLSVNSLAINIIYIIEYGLLGLILGYVIFNVFEIRNIKENL